MEDYLKNLKKFRLDEHNDPPISSDIIDSSYLLPILLIIPLCGQQLRMFDTYKFNLNFSKFSF